MCPPPPAAPLLARARRRRRAARDPNRPTVVQRVENFLTAASNAQNPFYELEKQLGEGHYDRLTPLCAATRPGLTDGNPLSPPAPSSCGRFGHHHCLFPLFFLT